jgi:hypothetical protein
MATRCANSDQYEYRIETVHLPEEEERYLPCSAENDV